MMYALKRHVKVVWDEPVEHIFEDDDFLDEDLPANKVMNHIYAYGRRNLPMNMGGLMAEDISATAYV